jgi:hypothetical protein
MLDYSPEEEEKIHGLCRGQELMKTNFSQRPHPRVEAPAKLMSFPRCMSQIQAVFWR